MCSLVRDFFRRSAFPQDTARIAIKAQDHILVFGVGALDVKEIRLRLVLRVGDGEIPFPGVDRCQQKDLLPVNDGSGGSVSGNCDLPADVLTFAPVSRRICSAGNTIAFRTAPLIPVVVISSLAECADEQSIQNGRGRKQRAHQPDEIHGLAFSHEDEIRSQSRTVPVLLPKLCVFTAAAFISQRNDAEVSRTAMCLGAANEVRRPAGTATEQNNRGEGNNPAESQMSEPELTSSNSEQSLSAGVLSGDCLSCSCCA